MTPDSTTDASGGGAQEATAPAATAPAATTWWRRELRSFAELAALCGFAIAQPLLDLFGRAPDQFVFRNAEAGDIWQWALVVALAPPVGLWLVEAAVGLARPGLRRRLHLVVVAVLVAMVAVQVGRSAVEGPVLVVAALAVGAGAAVLFRRSATVRRWLAFAAVGPLVFTALFLWGSETSALLTTADVATSEVSIADPAPVVMLVLDELPLAALVDGDGDIDAELHPNLARLADDSHWFRNTTAVSGSTWYAVPSIATGRYPADGTAPIVADHPDNLFTLLGGRYDLRVTESVTRLCPTDLCRPATGGPDARRALLRDAARVMRHRLSPRASGADPVAALVEDPAAHHTPSEDGFDDLALHQPTRFQALLDGLDRGGPTLHYLHILLPHVPYRYLPSGAQYPSPDPDLGRLDDDWDPERWPAELARQRLQLQVAYLDRLVGELIAELEAQGIYDEALVVLVADHGISFRPGGPIRAVEGQPLDDANTGELAWVPFLVKEPGQRDGTVSDANVETVDVLPTIADVLGVELPWPVDGRSALGPPRPDGTKTYYRSDVNDFGVEAVGPERFDGPTRWPGVLANATDAVLPAVGEDGRLWRAGPRAELVGTRVEDAPTGALEPVAIALEDAAAYDDVDPASGWVPALVRATLADDGRPGDLAVAVNGVVAATAPTYRWDETTRVAVVVSDEHFRSGANTVEVFRLR